MRLTLSCSRASTLPATIEATATPAQTTENVELAPTLGHELRNPGRGHGAADRVDEGHAEEQERRGRAGEDKVLDRRLDELRSRQGVGDERVERHAEDLQ